MRRREVRARTGVTASVGDLTGPIRNVGRVTNKGAEVSLNFRDKAGAFRYLQKPVGSKELADTVGLHRVRLFHLNDSVGGLASRRDRHCSHQRLTASRWA